MFHELGHYLFHMPNRTRNEDVTRGCGRNHYEAEITAALLLLPICEVEEILSSGAAAHDADLARLVGTRIECHALYKTA